MAKQENKYDDYINKWLDDFDDFNNGKKATITIDGSLEFLQYGADVKTVTEEK